jgi:aspartyl-tRNA(Asn)/glutamyl-tRNA(Gln) amidotransferase subunit A
VEAAYAQALTVLEGLGAVLVRDFQVPLIEQANAANLAILSAEAATHHQRNLDSRPQDYGADVLDRLTTGRLLPATLYLRAQQVRRRVRQEFRKALEKVALLALPMAPAPAPRIGQGSVELGGAQVDARTALTRYTGLFNLTGLPAISVPCGFTLGGLPVGFQLAGRPLDEATLLRAAHAYQRATPWWKRRPPLEGA